jgi:hypothetical protein
MTMATNEQLRNRIDRGLAGDKVAMPDPAAAPLGTDAEAAGASPTPQERALEIAATESNAGEPQIQRSGGIAIYLWLVIGVGALFLAIVTLAMG